jgi:hypothetical protein
MGYPRTPFIRAVASLDKTGTDADAWNTILSRKTITVWSTSLRATCSDMERQMGSRAIEERGGGHDVNGSPACDPPCPATQNRWESPMPR